jgi:hypothetical protein
MSEDSSWTEGDSDTDDPVMRFELPATDEELVQQVFNFVDTNTVDHGGMLLKMARRYRFAGYIGCIDYLFKEIDTLREEIEQIRQNSWYNYIKKCLKFI